MWLKCFPKLFTFFQIQLMSYKPWWTFWDITIIWNYKCVCFYSQNYKNLFLVILACMFCTTCCLLIKSCAFTEEVSPKFVKGTKRYGRRSRPDKTTSQLTDDTEKDETPSTGVRKATLKRSTSLESVEVRRFTLSVWFQGCYSYLIRDCINIYNTVCL